MRVIGQEPAKALLRQLRAHTLLFVGPERVGRRLTARWFAAWLNCQSLQHDLDSEPGNEPCGHCPSCLALEADSHPDYREIGPQATTTSGRLSRRPELRIDQLVPREGGSAEPLSRWLEQRPRFRRKVGVIDRADTLTPGAANAFLKFLEEPPSYTSIVLIAPSKEAVLPTIASRATILRFGTVAGDAANIASPELFQIEVSDHPAARLGQIGEFIEASEHKDAFGSLLNTVDDYLKALSRGLEPALEHADGLEKAWLAEENFDVPALLRARLSELSPSVYAAGLAALARCEEALASYASPGVALQVLTLELRRALKVVS